MNKLFIVALLLCSSQAFATMTASTEQGYQVTQSDCDGIKAIAEGAKAAKDEHVPSKYVMASVLKGADLENPGYRAMVPSIMKAVKSVYADKDGKAIDNAYNLCSKDIGQYYQYYSQG